jgi:hypothetical protein
VYLLWICADDESGRNTYGFYAVDPPPAIATIDAIPGAHLPCWDNHRE